MRSCRHDTHYTCNTKAYNYIKSSMKRSKTNMLARTGKAYTQTQNNHQMLKKYKKYVHTDKSGHDHKTETNVRIKCLLQLLPVFWKFIAFFPLCHQVEWPLLYRQSYFFCQHVHMLFVFLSLFGCFERSFRTVASSPQMSVQFGTLFFPHQAKWVHSKVADIVVVIIIVIWCFFFSRELLLNAMNVEVKRTAPKCCWYEFAIIKHSPQYRMYKLCTLRQKQQKKIRVASDDLLTATLENKHWFLMAQYF